MKPGTASGVSVAGGFGVGVGVGVTSVSDPGYTVVGAVRVGAGAGAGCGVTVVKVDPLGLVRVGALGAVGAGAELSIVVSVRASATGVVATLPPPPQAVSSVELRSRKSWVGLVFKVRMVRSVL